MKRIVLDASAIMTFFENRPGAEKVQDLIHLGVDGKRQLLMSVVNWGEVYYSTWRTKGPGFARKVIEDVAQLPLEIVNADLELTISRGSWATSSMTFRAKPGPLVRQVE